MNGKRHTPKRIAGDPWQDEIETSKAAAVDGLSRTMGIDKHRGLDLVSERYATTKKDKLAQVFVPLMLILSSAIMAMAWLGHLRYKEDLSFWMATLFAWLLVLPEYILNISAIRWGVGTYKPSEMAATNLSSGVVFIAVVSHFFLGEDLTLQKYVGFAIMIIAMILISGPSGREKFVARELETKEES